MSAQMAEPVTPGRGFPALGPEEEFHPITVRAVSDVTEVFCEGCGFSEHTGAGAELAVAHAADHAILTGHTVTERHVRVIVFSERPAKEDT